MSNLTPQKIAHRLNPNDRQWLKILTGVDQTFNKNSRFPTFQGLVKFTFLDRRNAVDVRLTELGLQVKQHI